MKVPQHLGIIFNSIPEWTLEDWNELLEFLNSLNIKYLTCYRRDGWTDIDLSCNTPLVSFIDYSKSKPYLASMTRDSCLTNSNISLDTKSNPVNLLLLETDFMDGFPPLMLAFTEILKLNSLDDSVSGFMNGIRNGIQRYSLTIQRNGV